MLSSTVTMLVFLAAATLAMPISTVARYSDYDFPHYMQCDPAWGKDTMGVPGPFPRSTICGEGCAMSCVAMLLAGMDVTIEGQTATPKTLNAWLVKNSLYHCQDGDCNNLILVAPEGLTDRLRFYNESRVLPPITEIATNVHANRRAYLAHVHNGHHFVMVVGADVANNAVYVHDPNYNITSYPLSGIVDFLMYDILPVEPKPNATTPTTYPLYKQCDQRWGNDTMQTRTVCAVGCLMSSTSMALNAWGIKVPTAQGLVEANPGSLNAWLRVNGGYIGDNNFEEAVLPKINPKVQWPIDGMHKTNDLPVEIIHDYLLRGRVVIANVDKGGHFVLVTGFHVSDPDTVFVNDPGFARTTYSYSRDIVGWRLFDMGEV